jgi:signal transduction histidine kinase/ligand-binding sensor domain-containing protein
MRILISFFILFLVLKPLSTYGQSYTLANTFSTKDGLLSQHIYDLITDDDGFLWIATDNGINKFDGKKFYNYSIKNGLTSDDVLQVKKDVDGTIWVNCYKQKPCYFDKVKNKFFPIRSENVQFNNFTSLNITNENKLIFGLSASYYDIKNNSLHQKFDVNPCLIIQLNSNPLKIQLSQKNIKVDYNINKQNEKIEISNTENINPNSIKQLKNGFLYLKKQKNYLYKLLFTSLTPFQYTLDSFYLPDLNTNFSKDGDKVTLFDHKGSLKIIDLKTLAILHEINQPKSLNCSYIDSIGNLWLGTIDNGLIKYTQFKTSKIESYKSANKNFLSIVPYHNESILAGNNHGEILQFANNKSTLIKNNIESNLMIRKIMISKYGTISLNDNYLQVNNEKIRVKNDLNKNTTSLKSAVLYEDSIVITGTIDGLYAVNILNKKIQKLNTVYKRTLSLALDKNNYIYYIGSNGLNKYDYKKNSNADIVVKQLSENEIFISLHFNDDNLLFASTNLGNIFILKNDKEIGKIKNTIGLPENITCIHCTDNKLWIGSKNGVCVLRYKDNDPMNIYSIFNITTNDGLPSNSINAINQLKDSIYVATNEGIAAVFLNFESKQAPIKVVLNRIKINQKDTIICTNYDLEYGQKDVSLTLAGVDLTGNFKFFEYSINNSKWIPIEGNILNLQIVDQHNEVNIRARNLNNRPSDKLLKLIFNVKIPFYYSQWFLIAMIFLFLILLFGSIYFAQLRIQKRKLLANIALFDERNRITSDLHDDIGATLSSLQINSAIANQLIIKNPTEAQKILFKIETQSQNLASNIGDIIWSMKSANNEFMTISTRIKNFANDILSATDIHYTIDIESVIDSIIFDISYRKNIVLITKEAINNAVKYSKATDLKVKIFYLNKQIHINIVDNGIGFVEKDTNGNGLENMRKRTKELNGAFHLLSNNNGTSISVAIPLS